MTQTEVQNLIDREVAKQLPLKLAESRRAVVNDLELQEARAKMEDRKLKESAAVFERLGLSKEGALAAARGREQRY